MGPTLVRFRLDDPQMEAVTEVPSGRNLSIRSRAALRRMVLVMPHDGIAALVELPG